MLYVRGLLALAMIGLGLTILARMLMVASAGIAIVPGLVLGAAMIALGVHRLSLILRIRRIT
ncbi:MAG: hypothetical protein WB609_10650 [Candidatus Cybelea sp.]